MHPMLSQIKESKAKKASRYIFKLEEVAAIDDTSIWVNDLSHYTTVFNTDDVLMFKTFEDLFLIYDFSDCIVNFIDIVIFHKFKCNCFARLMNACS